MTPPVALKAVFAVSNAVFYSAVASAALEQSMHVVPGLPIVHVSTVATIVHGMGILTRLVRLATGVVLAFDMYETFIFLFLIINYLVIICLKRENYCSILINFV